MSSIIIVDPVDPHLMSNNKSAYADRGGKGMILPPGIALGNDKTQSTVFLKLAFSVELV